MNRHPRQGASGWSLVELAVVLVVMGVMGTVVWRLLPAAPQVAAGDAAGRDLAAAEQALLGYALAHHRLPAPVISNGQQVLPADELGLPSRLVIRYQVQALLTSTPADLFKPLLPPASGHSDVFPALKQINGLDLCMRLKAINAASLDGMQGVPAAFALMHPGGIDNAAMASSADFVLPGTPDPTGRRIIAAGPGEFASRLACPERVARARGAARAAYSGWDLSRVAKEYLAFRTFTVQVAEMNKSNADAIVAIAATNVVIGVMQETVSVLQSSPGFPPDPFATAGGLAGIVATTAQLAVAVAKLASAISAAAKAETAVDTAREQKTAAAANLARMTALADQSLDRALYLDSQGLQP